MDFYNDNTYYSEDHFEDSINIGWIIPEEQWEVEVDNKDQIIEALQKYLKYPVNLVRGGNYYKRIILAEKEYTLGFAEFRILSQDKKKVYAVPDMIIYSILEQNYCPPNEFINALFDGIKPDTGEYQEYLKKYNECDFWGKNKEYINFSDYLVSLIKDGKNEKLITMIENDRSVLDIVTREGSLLNVAILNSREEIAFLLIEKGINIHKFDGLELLSAIKMKQDRISAYLIEKDVSIKTYNQKVNPLFYAVARKSTEAIKQLVNSKYKLLKTYNNEFVRECDIHVWANKVGNENICNLLKSIFSS